MSEYLNNPLRIINGDLPYRDFWLLFPPGEVYFPALVYKIFGINTDIARFITILTSCLIPVAGFYLGKITFVDNLKAIIVSLIFYFISIVSNYEGPDYLHLYLLFITLSTIVLIKFSRITDNKKGSLYLFYSGIFIGMAFFFKLYEVGGAFAGMVLSLIFIEYTKRIGIKAVFKSVSFYLSGVIIILLIISISFYSILGKMFHELVIESLKNGTSMNLPYFNDLYFVTESIRNDIKTLINAPGEIISLFYHLMKLITALGFYLLPILALIPIFYLKKLNSEQRNIAIIFLLWGIFSFPKAWGRADLAHLAPSAVPFLLFIFYTGINLKDNNKFINKFSIVVVSCMLLTSIFPIFKYASILKNPVHYVSANNGSVPFKSSNDANDFRRTLDYIKMNTNDNDFIFVTPWDAPPIYALANRKNPTYYDSLNDLIIRKNEEKQKAVISDIIKNKTKLIIHNPDWGYDNKPEQQFRIACGLIQDFIDNQCYPVARFGFYQIYKIKSNIY